MRSYLFALAAASMPTLSNSPAGQASCADRFHSPAAPAVAQADYDDDGLEDVLVFGVDVELRLLRNLGDGQFDDVTHCTGLAGLGPTRSAEWCDYDMDGKRDLLVLLADGRLRQFQGIGAGLLRDATKDLGLDDDLRAACARWTDYDRDRVPDLELHGSRGPVFLHGVGQGQYERVDLRSGPGAPNAHGRLQREVHEKKEVRSAEPGLAHESSNAPGSARPSSRGHRTAGADVRVVAATAGPGAPAVHAHGQGHVCADGVQDRSRRSHCIPASSVPLLGHLLPLGTHLFVDGEGKVGLGTLGPEMPLHVFSKEQSGLALFSSNTWAQLELRADADGDTGGPYGSTIAAHPSNGDLEVRVSDPIGSDLVVQRSTGHVGVGTDSPEDRLHVRQAGDSATATIEADHFAHLRLKSDSDADLGGPYQWVLASSGANGVLEIREYDRFGEVVGTRLTIEPGHDLGIGTQSPNADLEIAGGETDVEVRVTTPDDISQSRLVFSDSDGPDGFVIYDHSKGSLGLGARTSSTIPTDADLVIGPLGRTGLGTLTPHTDFVVSDPDKDGATTVEVDGGDGDGVLVLRGSLAAGPQSLRLDQNSIRAGQNGDLAVGADGLAGARIDLKASGRLVASNCNVGIGTEHPGARLDVDGQVISRGTGAGNALILEDESTGGSQWRISSGAREAGELNFWPNDLVAPESPRMSLTRGGDLRVEGKVTTATLEIVGGADIVEGFHSRESLDPGTLVVIDPRNAGELVASSEAYDKKVAGVVSGANGVEAGLRLGQAGTLDGEVPVAMVGRVWVKATAENGAIRPGDRLTTAATAGHAMRVTDEGRSAGAVIGKAMSSLSEGEGLVLTLVNLQ